MAPKTSYWSGEGAALGAWCMIPHPTVMEAVARCGFDFLCIDMQHGLADFESALAMMPAIDLGGSAPFVRVPWNDPAIIGRVLDAGAVGVIVPMINSVEDARRAVTACRYAPEGQRSFGPLRVGLRDGPSYFAEANRRIQLLVMIETAAALEEVDAIASLPGVNGLFVGPFDLSVSLGLPPGDNDGNPLFDEALEAVISAASAHGKYAGILSNRALAQRRHAQGFRFVSVATDFGVLQSAMAADLAEARQAFAEDESC